MMALGKRFLHYLAILAFFLLICIVSAVVFWNTKNLFTPTMAPVGTRPVQLILDAGHGGEDGGAVSVSGIPESKFNLDIVLKLNDVMNLYGEVPVLLRREDVSLHSPNAETLRQKKASDLKNRAEVIQSIPNGTLISIHQNIYPTQDVRGLQVFHAPTDGSAELAAVIQKAVRHTIQQENTRKAKQIPKEVYLLNHISCPAVLIECGFLSNPEEEALLRSETYQKKLAAVISAAWLNQAQ